jgi:hypothetical protein
VAVVELAAEMDLAVAQVAVVAEMLMEPQLVVLETHQALLQAKAITAVAVLAHQVTEEVAEVAVRLRLELLEYQVLLVLVEMEHQIL